MSDLVKENEIGVSNDSSKHSSVTLTVKTRSSGDQGTINQTEDIGPEGTVGPLMLHEPTQLESIELPRINETNPNIAPGEPAWPPRNLRRKRRHKRTRKRSVREITAGDTVTEERAPKRSTEMEPSAEGTSSATRGRRRRTNSIQVRPPLYSRLKRDEYEWYFPDYNE